MSMFMSYCRQGNTRLALKEALEQIEENRYAGVEMEASEIHSFTQYIELAYNWMVDMCLISEDGTLDYLTLNQITEELSSNR